MQWCSGPKLPMDKTVCLNGQVPQPTCFWTYQSQTGTLSMPHLKINTFFASSENEYLFCMCNSLLFRHTCNNASLIQYYTKPMTYLCNCATFTKTVHHFCSESNCLGQKSKTSELCIENFYCNILAHFLLLFFVAFD